MMWTCPGACVNAYHHTATIARRRDADDVNIYIAIGMLRLIWRRRDGGDRFTKELAAELQEPKVALLRRAINLLVHHNPHPHVVSSRQRVGLKMGSTPIRSSL